MKEPRQRGLDRRAPRLDPFPGDPRPARLRLKTAEGKASRSSDERKCGLQATLERGADRATQPSAVFKRSLRDADPPPRLGRTARLGRQAPLQVEGIRC